MPLALPGRNAPDSVYYIAQHGPSQDRGQHLGTNPGGFPMFAGLRNQVKLVKIPMNTPTMMEPTKTRTATNEAITNTTAFMNIWIPRAIVETKRAIWQPVFSNGFPAQAGWAVE